jgi:hypothetical protein
MTIYEPPVTASPKPLHCCFQGRFVARACSGSQVASVAPATTPTMRLTAWRRVNFSSAIVLVRSSNQFAIVISFCVENDYKSGAYPFYAFSSKPFKISSRERVIGIFPTEPTLCAEMPLAHKVSH